MSKSSSARRTKAPKGRKNVAHGVSRGRHHRPHRLGTPHHPPSARSRGPTRRLPPHPAPRSLKTSKSTPAPRRHSRHQTQNRLQGGRSIRGPGKRSLRPLRPAAGRAAMVWMPASSNWPSPKAAASSAANVACLITETRHGLICANSAVDVSNVDGGRHALLLPKDPDRSAARIHAAAEETSAPFHPCHHHRYFRKAMAGRADRSRHRRGRHEGFARLSRTPRSAQLQVAGQRRCRCRPTGLRCRPGLRQASSHSSMYHSRIRLSTRPRHRPGFDPPGGNWIYFARRCLC